MNSEEALRIIDDIANVIAVDIPENIELNGVVYPILREITSALNEGTFKKYQELYESLRDRIRNATDVPETLVKKALILRRALLFMKKYETEGELEDKKRWLNFVKKVGT